MPARRGRRKAQRTMAVKDAVREVITEGDITPIVARSLRADRGRGGVVVQVAAALEPVLAQAAQRRPSRLARLGHTVARTLGAAAPAVRAGRLRRIAQATTVGIVFADVADFTHYTAEHGDDAAVELLLDTGEVVARAVDVGRGELVKTFGDGFLMAFPSPSQAVRAGVRLADDAAKVKHGRPAPRFRIAVHAGRPTVTDDDLLGHDVNLTARLLEHCRPGEVLVSDAAKQSAERRLKSVAFAAPRKLNVRGVAEPVEVHRASPR